MEIHALVDREFDFMLTVRQQQTPMSVHILDKGRDGINVYGIRQITRQTHNNRDVGMVTFPRQGQRAININHYAGYVSENSACNQVIRELFACFHRANSMGAGRANADFENIEYANHEASIVYRGAPPRGAAQGN
jgi:hypothetical protein